ncbi:MAG: saccharopine dehydrogenase NADP-binding domain-containing protein [Sphingomicrobium sp.]
MILGGTGNFGSFVARMLAHDPAITLLLASRSETRARAAAIALAAANPPEPLSVDIRADPASMITSARPDVVIHTVGPFQDQDYRVARAAILAGAHYLDLADARDFVAGIGQLDMKAKAAGVAVIAGASSVPCLTAAFIDHYRPRFAQLSSVKYGISAAQATNRGLGTASAILSYVGKPFTRLEAGRSRRVFGWQGLTAVRYPELGLRLFGDCDIPDLSLFPGRYPGLERLRFVAGHEIKLLHLGTWLLSWAVRLRLMRSLETHADALLRASFLFDPLGSNRSGFHIRFDGIGHDGAPMWVKGFMVARQGHGPHIPCLPAVLLAKRIAAGELPAVGARPCLDLIDLDQYLAALESLDITTTVKGPGIDDAWPKEMA